MTWILTGIRVFKLSFRDHCFYFWQPSGNESWWLGAGGVPPIYVGSHSFLSAAFPRISAMPEGAGLIGSRPAWCFSCTHTSNSCVATEVFVCGSFSLAEGDLLVLGSSLAFLPCCGGSRHPSQLLARETGEPLQGLAAGIGRKTLTCEQIYLLGFSVKSAETCL